MNNDRKIAILSSAKRCFLKYSYDKTTLDDISEIVGINKVSLYHYYKNKEAIFIELVNIEAEEYAEYLKNKVENIDDLKSKILSWIDEGFKYNQNDSILKQLTYDSLKKISPQLEELKNDAMKKGTDFLISLLDSYKEKNKIIPCDTKKISETIQNVIYSIKDSFYLRSKSNINKELDFNKMIEQILFTVSLILDGIIKI